MKDLLRKGIFLLSVLPSTFFLPKPSYHSLGAASNNYCAGQAATRHFGTWRHHHLDENWITCVDIQKIKFQHLHLLPPKRNKTEKHDATKNLTSLVHKRICNPGIASYIWYLYVSLCFFCGCFLWSWDQALCFFKITLNFQTKGRVGGSNLFFLQEILFSFPKLQPFPRSSPRCFCWSCCEL